MRRKRKNYRIREKDDEKKNKNFTRKNMNRKDKWKYF